MTVVIRAADRRVSTTPNATMTTLATPTQGGAATRLWWVEMEPGATGPVHAFRAEVVWAVTSGSATLECGGHRTELGAGDTAVLPGGALRSFVAGPLGLGAVVTTAGAGEVTRGDDAAAVVPPWVA